MLDLTATARTARGRLELPPHTRLGLEAGELNVEALATATRLEVRLKARFVLR